MEIWGILQEMKIWGILQEMEIWREIKAMGFWGIVIWVVLGFGALFCEVFKDQVKDYLGPTLREFVSWISSAMGRFRNPQAAAPANPPLPLDQRRLSLTMDGNGKNCCMIGAWGLDIEHVEKPRHWNWTSHPATRFPEVVELLSVYWLEIGGLVNLELLSPSTTYAIYLVFQYASVTRGLSLPAEATTRLLVADGNGTEETKCTVYMEDRQWTGDNYPKERSDGWMEIQMGKFSIKHENHGKIYIKLKQLDLDHEKKGLILEGIEIRAK